MKTAYLINRDSVGGGMEYIRRRIAAHPGDESRVFFSDRGECTAAKLNAWGAELVHANHLKALVQLYRNPLSRPRAKVVFTVHGIHARKYDFLPRTFANRLKRALRVGLERRLYRKVDELIALNRDDVGRLQTVYGVTKPIRLEPNAVAPSPPDAREPEFAFVTVARFDFQKGYDVLLAAVDRVRTELRAAKKRTLLIGGGETLADMKAFAAEKGISDLVEFAGEVPHGSGEMYRGRVLVAPSRWEGSPYTVLEALARGKKVIASACPGHTDIVEEDVNGWLFPVGDVSALAGLLVSR